MLIRNEFHSMVKGADEEEYIMTPARENRPLAGRRFQERIMEGSF